jgi:Cu/Ag efflux protein CusF
MSAAVLALVSAAASAADPMPAHAGHGAMGHDMGAKSSAAAPAAAVEHAGHTATGHDASAKPNAATAAAPMVDAEVRRVDAAAGKLTLRHGPLPNLDMGAMTMAFAVKDAAWLKTAKVGDKVRVAVERVNGTLTIVALEAATP